TSHVTKDGGHTRRARPAVLSGDARARAPDLPPELPHAAGDGARGDGGAAAPADGARGDRIAPAGARRRGAARRGGRPEELQLLAALRDRRLPLLLLRRLAERLPARDRNF